MRSILDMTEAPEEHHLKKRDGVDARLLASRALFEEVAFDRAKVTSTDWLSYPMKGRNPPF
jgi:hypothetical protein